MRRFALIPATVAFLAIAAPALALPGLEAGVRGYYWFPDLSGKMQTFVSGVTGTKLDLENDLGVESENLPAGEAFARFGRIHLRLGYTPLNFDGSRTTGPIVFGTRTFGAGTIASSLDVKMLDGDLQVDLLRPDLVAASVNLGLVVKVKYVDGSVELASAGVRETRDFKAPVPMVGLAAGVGILKDVLRADARLTGMAYSGNHIYEGDVFASFVPFPFVRIQGGYRAVDIKVDEDDIVAELKLKGPYVGAQLSF